MSLFDLEDLLRSRRVPDKNYESCSECIHADDSLEMCVLRRCIHAKGELQECYVPKQAERKRGKWIRQDNKGKPLFGWYQCSECGAVIGGKANFCSECGADMREVDDERLIYTRNNSRDV